MLRIRRALISVSDKRGVVEFAQALARMGVRFFSTGGTAKMLREVGLEVEDVSRYTGFPEILDGRVKTLHPRIHGGILALRDRPTHLEALQAHHIEPIDMVVVNLYPFERTVGREGIALEEALEQIDIGGPTLLRAAAKNFLYVVPVVDPEDYPRILQEMESSGGEVSRSTRLDLARKVFAHTARYDAAITTYLSRVEGEGAVRFPEVLTLTFQKVTHLRYGENPHQQAAFYQDPLPRGTTLVRARQLQGKEMSYNNYLDAHAALELIQEFSEPAAVIIKHNNPCGAALGSTLQEAFLRAREADPVSAFGGIIALNRIVDPETAEAILEQFCEVVLAPEFSEEALDRFRKKQALRLLEVGPLGNPPPGMEFRTISGGLLYQEPDRGDLDQVHLRVVTRKTPTDAQWRDLRFAWKVARHVKSNAIVLAREGQTLGIGAGQMSRVDSVRLAVEKAQSSLEGAVMASDGFFPFRDALDVAADRGVAAVIQPGGSIRDQEVIRAAEERGLAMVFTGIRHFRH